MKGRRLSPLHQFPHIDTVLLLVARMAYNILDVSFFRIGLPVFVVFLDDSLFYRTTAFHSRHVHEIISIVIISIVLLGDDVLLGDILCYGDRLVSMSYVFGCCCPPAVVLRT